MFGLLAPIDLLPEGILQHYSRSCMQLKITEAPEGTFRHQSTQQIHQVLPLSAAAAASVPHAAAVLGHVDGVRFAPCRNNATSRLQPAENRKYRGDQLHKGQVDSISLRKKNKDCPPATCTACAQQDTCPALSQAVQQHANTPAAQLRNHRTSPHAAHPHTIAAINLSPADLCSFVKLTSSARGKWTASGCDRSPSASTCNLQNLCTMGCRPATGWSAACTCTC
jgi:hypothetical protein